MNTWKVAYTIHDGEQEYSQYFTCEFAAETLDETVVATMIADHFLLSEKYYPKERRGFLQELKQEGYADLPDDYRAISELGWEKVSPIIITVRNGFVEAVNGVPEGTTVEVRDWDNGELDEQGEPVPTVSEWTGPC